VVVVQGIHFCSIHCRFRVKPKCMLEPQAMMQTL
jgi:hypothetical protein